RGRPITRIVARGNGAGRRTRRAGRRPLLSWRARLPGGASVSVPVLLPTGVRDETFGGVTYHVEGELVPVLQVELAGMPIYFEHHVLLWKDPRVEIGVKSLKGAFKRALAGIPIFMTEAKGPG